MSGGGCGSTVGRKEYGSNQSGKKREMEERRKGWRRMFSREVGRY